MEGRRFDTLPAHALRIFPDTADESRRKVACAYPRSQLRGDTSNATSTRVAPFLGSIHGLHDPEGGRGGFPWFTPPRAVHWEFLPPPYGLRRGADGLNAYGMNGKNYYYYY